jgi:hypothetical protein
MSAQRRSKVMDRLQGGNGFKTELKLDCGHTIYVQPFGRYARAATVTCIVCYPTQTQETDSE